MYVIQVTSKSLGGSGTYIELLSKGLRDSGVRVGLCYRHGSIQDERLESSADQVWHFPNSIGFHPLNLVINIYFLYKLIRSERPDIVHTHTSLGGFVGRLAAWLAGKSVIVHTAHAFGADEFTPQPAKTMFRAIEMFLSQLTDHTICVSRYMRLYGRRMCLLKWEKSTVIHNTIGMYPKPDAAIVESTMQAIRSERGISPSSTLCFFAGRLEEQKGISYLIQSVAILNGQVGSREFDLLICGQGALEGNLRDEVQARELNQQVHFLGWRSNVPTLMAGCDIFVLPSVWESFGLVNLEAMACAKPVVATCTQGIPEVVTDQTGILVPICDPPALASALLKLIANSALREVLGAAGRERYVSNFGYDKHVSAHLACYGKLLEK